MAHSRIWINAHQAGEENLRLATSLGVGGVRIDGIWPDLEPALGHMNYGWLDELLATCATLGLQVYITLGDSPSWLGIGRKDLPPVDDWSRFCKAFATYYAGRLTFVGCWNEWSGDPEEYVRRLLRPMAEALRAADPHYMICAPDLETERDWPDRLREILVHGNDCLDILTVHAYDADGQAVWEKLTKRRSWFEQVFLRRKPSVEQVVAQAGWHPKRCWVTETGMRSDTAGGEDGQAQFVDQVLKRILGHSWPHGICLFNLRDEGHSWGMFRSDGTPKPAAGVIQRHAGVPIT